MSRSRPASNPISYHQHTNQYYVTRAGKRIYLCSDKEEAIKKYHKLNLEIETSLPETVMPAEITLKELANRFIASQQARRDGSLRVMDVENGSELLTLEGFMLDVLLIAYSPDSRVFKYYVLFAPEYEP